MPRPTRVLCSCAQAGAVGDVYAHKYKGIALALAMLSRALNGAYVNFGVFALYSDPALDNALNAAMEMALAIPARDVVAYSKVARAYFVFLEAVCHNHAAFLVQQPHESFVRLVHCLQAGIKSVDVNTSSQCAMAVDQLASWLHRNLVADDLGKAHPAAQVSRLPPTLAAAVEPFEILRRSRVCGRGAPAVTAVKHPKRVLCRCLHRMRRVLRRFSQSFCRPFWRSPCSRNVSTSGVCPDRCSR